MNQLKVTFQLLMLLALSIISKDNIAATTISNLKCEYANSPINIDNPNPHLSWTLLSNGRGVYQSAYQVMVSTTSDMKSILWNSEIVRSSKSFQVNYSGSKLKSNSNYYWQVKVWTNKNEEIISKITSFWTAQLIDINWIAKWIGAGPEIEPRSPKGFFKDVKEQYQFSDTIDHSGKSLLLRNVFDCNKKITSARVFVTGLGFYELYLNGIKVGDHVLSPAKTNYRKEILYDTYDVTEMLQNGKNAVGLHLGNGWFNPYKKWWKEYRMQWFGAKRAFMQLHIKYQNGEEEIIVTDENWKYKDGPIDYNCIYDGEHYNATEEIEDWNLVSFNDEDWIPVNIVEAPGGRLRSQTMQAIKVVESFTPTNITNPSPDVFVYDMGQNFTGWVKIKLHGKRGTKLHLQFAEDINEDGSIDITSNEHAKAEATYVLKGDSVEIYETRFSYYGFKYVEVRTEQDLPKILNIQGQVVYSDNQLTGSFECDNETINKIHKATVWSQKSNMIGYPLDCPQRDERLGWFGDVQVTIDEALFNFDMPLFYQNWITGIRHNQNEITGDLPIISPRPYIWDEGVEWSSTYLILLWKYYVNYGDKNILLKNYDVMKKYLSFLDSIAEDDIVPSGWIGDWGSLVQGWHEGEPISVSTAFYFWNSIILSKTAKVLGREIESKYFYNKAASIKKAYNKHFFNPETKDYNDGSQMANAFPLYLGLVPEEYEYDVLKNLVHDIEVMNNGHLTTGVLGSKYMIDALVKFGRADVAYSLATQTGYPSWSDMVEKYTTMCEFWTLKQSHNHVMTGSIDAFFYNTLAGIKLNDNYPGCERITIKPFIPDSLSYAKAQIETILGKVSVYWNKEDEGIIFKIEIPANMSADVILPNYEASIITEGGISTDKSEGIKFISSDDVSTHYFVGSGKYEFLVKN